MRVRLCVRAVLQQLSFLNVYLQRSERKCVYVCGRECTNNKVNKQMIMLNN